MDLENVASEVEESMLEDCFEYLLQTASRCLGKIEPVTCW